MVLKILIGVDSEAPCVVVPIHAYHPTSKMVSFNVLVLVLAYIVSAGHERVEKRLKAAVALQLFHTALAVGLIARSAEYCSHLATKLERERAKPVLVAYLQVKRLAMVKHAVGILALALGEIVLPIVIGHAPVGHMPLKVKPAVAERQRPILRQGQTRLRHGARVYSQCLRAAAQPIVLQLHWILLAAECQHAVKPPPFDISLLDNDFAREIIRHGHVDAETHAPTPGRVGMQRPRHAGHYVSVVFL